jgi:hypothetical protein
MTSSWVQCCYLKNIGKALRYVNWIRVGGSRFRIKEVDKTHVTKVQRDYTEGSLFAIAFNFQILNTRE